MQQRGLPVKTEKKKRLIYLDLVRGTFLVFIILNHVPFAPKFTDVFTGNGALISSAAEGFFLLSGLMVAYLYLPKILSNTQKILGKIWKRAGLLYVLSISTTLIFTLLAVTLKTDPTSGTLFNGDLLSLAFIRDLLSLNYIYGWADFLARYAVFMLFAPAALFLIAYKKTPLLIGLSLLLWFISPSIGAEHFSAWQVLFVAGMIIGSRLDAIIAFFKQSKNQAYLITLIVVSAISITWSTYTDLLYPSVIVFHFDNSLFSTLQSLLQIPQPVHDALFNKERMPLLRIAISILWFLAVLIVYEKYENNIKKYTGSFLTFLGQNSLTVYVIHSFIIFIVFIAFVQTIHQPGFTVNTLIGVGAVATVLALVSIYLTLIGKKNKPKSFLELIKGPFRR